MLFKIHFYRAGDVMKSVCPKCAEIRTASLLYADYRSTTTGKKIPNVLQAFCDTCGTLTTIPHQSTPRIREHLDTHMSPLEIRIAPHLEDVVYVVGDRAGTDFSDTAKLILGFYFRDLNKGAMRKKLKLALDNEFGTGKVTSRISLKVLGKVMTGLDKESDHLGINRSQLIKAILVQAKLDLLDHADSKHAQRFYEAARMMAA